MTRSVFFFALVLSFWSGLALESEAAGPASLFDEQIRPLLVDKCLACHSGETPKGKLDLTRRASAMAGGEGGEAIVP
ncbi:c-type cytochrome domain-containing protein, partial [Singulisphaera rosea]